MKALAFHACRGTIVKNYINNTKNSLTARPNTDIVIEIGNFFSNSFPMQFIRGIADLGHSDGGHSDQASIYYRYSHDFFRWSLQAERGHACKLSHFYIYPNPKLDYSSHPHCYTIFGINQIFSGFLFQLASIHPRVDFNGLYYHLNN